MDDVIRSTIPTRGPREWQEAQREVLREMDDHVEGRLAAVRDELLRARERLVAKLKGLGPDEWQARRLRDVVAETDRIIGRLGERLDDVARKGVARAAELGREAVAAPLDAVGKIPGAHSFSGVVPALDVNALALAQETAGDLIVGVTEDLARAVRVHVTQAIAGEKSLFETIEAIAGELDASGSPTPSVFSGSFYRAETIARTETVGAFNRSQNHAIRKTAEAVPGLLKKTWLATRDDRTRPSHRRMDGTTIDAAAKFSLAGLEVDGPHDPKLPPGELINCRCTLVVVPAAT